MKIDCKKIANEKLEKIKNELKGHTEGKYVSIIQWNDFADSNKYIKNKVDKIKLCGLDVQLTKLNKNTDVLEVKRFINNLNLDNDCVGIIAQFPFFDECRRFESSVTQAISPLKDIDSITKVNKLNIYNGSNRYLPCTVQGVIDSLQGLEYTNVLIVGRSEIVGKPLFHAMLNMNKNPMIAHSITNKSDLEKMVSIADVIVCATGNIGLLDGIDLTNKIVIDVGINFNDKGAIVGDVFEEQKQSASHYTSVPGGIGLLTTVNVMGNIKKLILGK